MFSKTSRLAATSEEIVALDNLSNVVATPHIAYSTIETAVRLGDELVQNI